MTAIGQLLQQLDADELRQLAERLRPFLSNDDGWLDARVSRKGSWSGWSGPAVEATVVLGPVCGAV